MRRCAAFLLAGVLALVPACRAADPHRAEAAPAEPGPVQDVGPTCDALPPPPAPAPSEIAEGVTVRGRVVAEDGGLPVEAALVRTSDRRESRTDADGRFEVRGLPSFVVLFVRAPGYVMGRVPVLDRAAGEIVTLEIPLTRAARFTGVVLDGTGRPVAGAWVHQKWWRVAGVFHPEETPPPEGVSTDAEGRFRLDEVPPGPARRIFAARRDIGAGVAEVPETRAGEEVGNVVIRLERAARADFVVSTMTNERPPKLTLDLRFGKRDPWAPVDGLRQAFLPDPTITGPDFSLPGLTGEPFTLWIHAEGWIPERLTSEEILPEPGRWTRRVGPVLSRGRSVSGQLLDLEGKPLVGALIHVRPPRGDPRHGQPYSCRHGRTDAEGRFVVGGLLEGVYVIRAAPVGDRFSTEVATGVRAGTEGLQLRMEPRGD